jgi:hypothetical protein
MSAGLDDGDGGSGGYLRSISSPGASDAALPDLAHCPAATSSSLASWCFGAFWNSPCLSAQALSAAIAETTDRFFQRPIHARATRASFPWAPSFRDRWSIWRHHRPGGDRLGVLSEDVRRPNGWPDAATSRHTGHPGTGRAGAAGKLGHSRPGNDYLGAAACLPLAVSGTP